MQVPSPGPESQILLPLLFVCLILVCILCTSCLILVIIVVKFTIQTQRGPLVETNAKDNKQDSKDKVKEQIEKTIKKLVAPVQSISQSAQDHLPKNLFKHQHNPQSPHPTPNMSSHTQHLVAVATPEANTILFQVNDKYELCLYESSTPVENDEQPYDFRTIKVNGAPVKVNNGIPVIAAVAFSVSSYCGGEAQVRGNQTARR